MTFIRTETEIKRILSEDLTSLCDDYMDIKVTLQYRVPVFSFYFILIITRDPLFTFTWSNNRLVTTNSLTVLT